MYKYFLVFIGLIFFMSQSALAEITFFETKYGNAIISLGKIRTLIATHFDSNQYRRIKAQIIYNQKQEIDHVIVFLFDKNYHSVDAVRMNLTSRYEVLSLENHYKLTDEDFAQQPGAISNSLECPDPSVQFIVFAPNPDLLEQRLANEVADAAESHHLKTIRLLKAEATRSHYLNYMSCPNVKGNFYDGDANPQFILTGDGVISAYDIDFLLAKKFKYQMLNIWVASQAFNDPLYSALIKGARAQKYGAGVNKLYLGPSDRAGACAMKSAMEGGPMLQGFRICYYKWDIAADLWGFEGYGSNYFGT